MRQSRSVTAGSRAPAGTFESVDPKPEPEESVMTRDSFLQNAKPITFKLADYPLTAAVRQFSTNSCGFHASEKVTLPIGDENVRCQVQVSIVIIGSKEWEGGAA